MTKDYYKKKAHKLLKNLETYKIAVKTMKELEACGVISSRKISTAQTKRIYYEHLISSAERAMKLLTPNERTVIEELYLKPIEDNIYDICDACNQERSTIYRNRTTALEKIGRAVFGLL